MAEWGGPRPGAGRKPKEPGKTRVTLSTRVSERSSEQLRAYAKRSGKALGQVLDEMVDFVGAQPGFEVHIASPATPAGLVAPGLPAGTGLGQLFLTQALIDRLPGGIAVADAELVVRIANAAFRAAVGRSSAEVVGQPVTEALGACLRAADAACQRALALGEPQALRCDGGLDGDPEASWDVQVWALHDAEGAIEGVALYVMPAEAGHRAEAP